MTALVEACVFCEIDPGRIQFENDLAFAMPDGFPVTSLHALVISKRHTPDYFSLTESELIACNELLWRLRVKILSEDQSVTGFNIGINITPEEMMAELFPVISARLKRFGKTSGVLSANLMRLATDTSKFGRWGDNYAYHIGDLSSVVLPGHDERVQTQKYRSWATALFEGINTDRPRLRLPVFFWVKAWREDDVGIWTEFGPTRLSFLEYLLIGIASSIFPQLLNREGHSRRQIP